MSLQTWKIRALPGVLAACLAACAEMPRPLPAGAHAVQDPALTEMSGLVASARAPGLLWSVNDSGSLPRLFRLDEQGHALGRVWVRGAWLHDTEALATWRDGDRHWLLLGDVGDNRARRDSVVVHAVAEPGADDELADIAWSLHFRYPDGPRDVEAMAVDASTGDLLLVSKRDLPRRVYRVPLAARDDDGVATAELITTLPAASVLGAVTGLDLDATGRELVLLSYTHLYLWERAPGEPWGEVLARPPRTLARPEMYKTEAVALPPRPGHVLVGGERAGAPLWSGRYRPDAGGGAAPETEAGLR